MGHTPSFFFPGEDFFFTRSYINGFNIRCDHSASFVSDNIISFVIDGAPDAVFYVTINEKFIPWSSNHFRLGDIVEDCYYTFLGVPQSTAFPYDVGYLIPLNETRGSIHINVHYGADNITIPLPYSPPGDYWLPDPLT